MIESIDLRSDEATKLGLRPTPMRGLGQVVILAGPNGGGKSRYLTAVGQFLKQYEPAVLEHKHVAAKMPRIADTSDDELQNLLKSRTVPGAEREAAYRKLACRVSLTGEVPEPVLVDYNRMPGQITDPRTMPYGDIKRGTLAQPGKRLEDSYHNMHAFLDGLARARNDASHAIHSGNENLAERIARADLFDELLTTLVGAQVSFRLDDTWPVPRLLDRDFNPVELSTGQRILVAWAMQLLEGPSWRPVVFLIDEPERYLHPAACIAVLEGIRTRLLGEHDQMWIATHSPSVVAHFGTESLYRVEGGAIRFAGSKVSDVMDSLLGGAEGRRQLVALLSDAHHVAFLKFAVESLLGPAIASAMADDPQQNQFALICAARVNAERPVRVLDYGAGRARFATALADGLSDEQRSQVEYIAFNHPDYDEHAEECAANVARLDGAGSVCNKLSDLWLDRSRVDVVVMCNFLHEVRPQDWRTHFKEISKVLNEDGALVILEDQQMNVGELPHDQGFLVLDLDEMRDLFHPGEGVDELTRTNHRLSAIAIPKATLREPTPDDLIRALERLKDRSLQGIEALRSSRSFDHREGRAHARLTMQFANACLALRKLGR